MTQTDKYREKTETEQSWVSNTSKTTQSKTSFALETATSSDLFILLWPAQSVHTLTPPVSFNSLRFVHITGPECDNMQTLPLLKSFNYHFIWTYKHLAAALLTQDESVFINCPVSCIALFSTLSRLLKHSSDVTSVNNSVSSLSEHLVGSDPCAVCWSPIKHADKETERHSSHHFHTLLSPWLPGVSCSTHWLNFMTVHM